MIEHGAQDLLLERLDPVGSGGDPRLQPVAHLLLGAVDGIDGQRPIGQGLGSPGVERGEDAIAHLGGGAVRQRLARAELLDVPAVQEVGARGAVALVALGLLRPPELELHVAKLLLERP